MSRRKDPIAKCGCWKDSKGVDHTPGCECTAKKSPKTDTTDNPAKEDEKKEEKK